MSAKIRALALELFCLPSIQAQGLHGSFKLAGETGSIADRCGKAAEALVAVVEEQQVQGLLAQSALIVYGGMPGVLGNISDEDRKNLAREAIRRVREFVSHFNVEEPAAKAEAQSGKLLPPSEQSGDAGKSDSPAGGVDGKQAGPSAVEDVPTEKLELPQKTIELLLSLSTPEVDLTTAKKIREADKKQSIEALPKVGAAIRSKVLEAIVKAIGPE